MLEYFLLVDFILGTVWLKPRSKNVFENAWKKPCDTDKSKPFSNTQEEIHNSIENVL